MVFWTWGNVHNFDKKWGHKMIVVGMSGGVDSAVSAYVLKQQGYSVIGLLMRNWEDAQCPIEDDARDVARVCDALDIPHYTVNFADAYRTRVFQSFLDMHKKGVTPNPDVLCNREIKFGELLRTAKQLGASHVATGHYAAIRKEGDHFLLKKSADSSKDQTYFLHQLNQHQLSHALFPLATMHKKDVRAIAHALRLPVAAKKDSTGICFIGERHYRTFLKPFVHSTPGPLVDVTTGNVVGTHEGYSLYTIGQRHGLRIGGGGNGAPWYVVDKDVPSNSVFVVQGTHNPARYAPALRACDVHWIRGEAPLFPLSCMAMIRYRQQPQHATVTAHDDDIIVTFDEPQRGICPGQSVVLYDGDVCLGGAVIARVLRE